MFNLIESCVLRATSLQSAALAGLDLDIRQSLLWLRSVSRNLMTTAVNKINEVNQLHPHNHQPSSQARCLQISPLTKVGCLMKHLSDMAVCLMWRSEDYNYTITGTKHHIPDTAGTGHIPTLLIMLAVIIICTILGTVLNPTTSHGLQDSFLASSSSDISKIVKLSRHWKHSTTNFYIRLLQKA